MIFLRNLDLDSSNKIINLSAATNPSDAVRLDQLIWTNITNKPELFAMGVGTVNTVTTDWNTITSDGTYIVQGASWGATLNSPGNIFSDAYTYGLLEVFNNNGNVVTQRYTTHSSHAVYTRSKYNASDWVSWQRVITESTNISNNYITKKGSNGTLIQSQIFDNGSNVGVGVASPLTRLDISNTQSNGITMRYDATANYRASITPYWNSSSDTRLDFAINNTSGAPLTTVMSLNGTGNVGIGTTTPNQKLEIANAGAVSIRLFNTTANYWDITNTTPSGTLDFLRGGTTYVSLANNGAMGLNTTASNSYRLDINGSTRFRGMLELLTNTDMTFNAYYSGGWKYRSNGYASDIFQDASGNIVFYTAPSGVADAAATLTNRFTIYNNGGVISGGGVFTGNSNIGMTNDGTSLFLKSLSSTYLNSANNAYVSSVGLGRFTDLEIRGTTSTDGYATISRGGSAQSGYINFYMANGSRASYIGYAANGGATQLYSDNGQGFRIGNGNLDMSNNKITGLAPATNSTDAVNKSQLDAVSTNLLASNNVWTGSNTFSNYNLILKDNTNPKTSNSYLKFISFRDNADSEIGWFGYGSTNNNDFFINNSSGLVRLYANGSEEVRIGSSLINMFAPLDVGTNTITSGKISINAVGSMLELTQSSIGSPSYIAFDNTIESGGARWRFGYTGFSTDKGSFSIGNQTNNRLDFLISNTGNVSIGGTTIPSERLEIRRDDNVNRTTYTDIVSINAPSNAAPYNGHGAGILFKGSNYRNSTPVNWGRIGMVIHSNSSDTYGSSMFFDVTPLDNGVIARAMTIRYDGNVGIGISSPTQKLDVNGAGQFSNNIVAKGTLVQYSGAGAFLSYESYGGRLESYDYINSTYKNIHISPNGGNVGIGLIASPTAKLTVVSSVGEVFRADVASGAYRIIADQAGVYLNGNVGIGTVSPQSKLDVNGNMVVGINNQYGIYTRIAGGTIKPFFATSGNNTLFYNTNAVGNILFRNTADDASIVSINDAGNLTARDFNASRGDGTGVYYFAGTINRYLYYNGSQYILNAANLDVTNNKITSLLAGTSPTDAVNKSQLDTKLNNDLTGSTGISNVAFNNYIGNVDNLSAPVGTRIFGSFDRSGSSIGVDLLQYNLPTSVEQTTDGTNWTSLAYNSGLFTGTLSNNFDGTNIGNGVQKVRFTWNGFGYRIFSTLLLSHSSNGNNITLKVQRSSDGVTWTDIMSTTTNQSGWPGYAILHQVAQTTTTESRLRIEITYIWSNANNAAIGGISLIGSYGGYNPLYLTDVNRNITAYGGLSLGSGSGLTGSSKLDVTSSTSSGTDPIAKFLHTNLSQGIGIGYNGISAVGSNANQDLNLVAKGTGVIHTNGYRITGLPNASISTDALPLGQADGKYMLKTGNPNNTDQWINFRVINNSNTSSSNDGMYIGYANSNSGITRIFGGGHTAGGIEVRGSGNNDVKINGNTAFHAGNYDQINVSSFVTGTLPDVRLSTNVALKNINNNFSTNQTVAGILYANSVDAINGGLKTNSATNEGGFVSIFNSSKTGNIAQDWRILNMTGGYGNGLVFWSYNQSGTGSAGRTLTIGDDGNITANRGNISTVGQLISTIATGTAPLTVASTTVVSNLNSDLLDGYQGSDFARIANANVFTSNQAISRSTEASLLLLSDSKTANFSLKSTGELRLQNGTDATIFISDGSGKIGINSAINNSYSTTIAGTSGVLINGVTINATADLVANKLTATNAATNANNTQVYSVGSAGVLEKTTATDLPMTGYGLITVPSQTVDIGGGVLRHIITLDCENKVNKVFRINMNLMGSNGLNVSFTNSRAGGIYILNYYNGINQLISYQNNVKLQDGTSNFADFNYSTQFTHILTSYLGSAGGNIMIKAF